MTRAYCYTQDAGRPHGMQDVTEIDDRAPVYRHGGEVVFTWRAFGCGCRRLVETRADA